MGTGGRSSRASHIQPSAPILAGLPNRRYSVPETIMRKYNLTKQHSDSNNSDSEAVTVPTLTPETMSISSPSKIKVAGSSVAQAGKTPPEDRRRKQGRASLRDDFKRSGRKNTIKKGPPMYKGNKGNMESMSDETESDGKTSDDIRESEESGGKASDGEKIESPDCLECKVFLGVIAEENDKVMNRSTNTIGKPVVEENGDKREKRNATSERNVNGRFEIIPVEIHAAVENERSSPESVDSFRSNGLPLNDIVDGYNPILSNSKNTPSKQNELSISNKLSNVIAPVTVIIEHSLSPPPNSEETNSTNTSLERVSPDEQLMSSPEAGLRISDDSDRMKKSAKESPESYSTLDKTTGFSEQTTPGTEGTSSTSDKRETPPDINIDRIPSLDLGSGSCSLTPVSSESSVNTSPDRPSVESSLTNGGSSSMTLYQPSTDRSSSTQDSTMSIPSDSVPQSRAFSLLSSHSTDQEAINKSIEMESDEEEEGRERKSEEVNDKISTEQDSTSDTKDQVNKEYENNNSVQLAALSPSKTDESPLHSLANNECTTNEMLVEKSDASISGKSQSCDSNTSDEDTKRKDLPMNDDNSNLSVTEKSSPVDLSNIKHLHNSDSPINEEDSKFCSTSTKNNLLPNKNNTSDIQKNVEVFPPQEKYPINRPYSFLNKPILKIPTISPSSKTPNEIVFSPESKIADDANTDIYSWNNRFDEDQYVKLTNQRQRYWMNRKPSGVSLPVTPIHGALTSVGAGTVYRKNNYDVQLVVPRYSALPRSISMLVNTSSADCSSNSSDSECLSAVDSLDEISAASPKHYHHYRPQDVIELLPEQTEGNLGDRLKVPVPKSPAKVKPFFISMNEPDKTTSDSPVMSKLMPDKLKEKLHQRHQVIELKRQKKVESQELKDKEAKEQELRNAKMQKEQRMRLKGKKSPREKVAKVLAKKEVKTNPRDFKGSYKNTESLDKPGEQIMNKDKKYLIQSEKLDSKKPNEIGASKLPQKSSIPIMKSPIELHKTLPSKMNNHQLSSSSPSSQKPSQLPIRRRHQSPPMRRSANLLGNRFQQRFEVIPEERSGSLESSNEEPGRLVGRARSLSLPASKQLLKDSNSEGDMKIDNKEGLPNDVTRMKRSDNQNTSTENVNKKLTRPIRSIRTNNTMNGPLIESVMIQEIVDEPYKGRAALAPHTDEGMSSLSKGWINFYLLKDGGGKSSPDNYSDDALLTLSDRERKNSTKNPIHQALKSVNVVGGSGNRIRTYTIPNHTLPSGKRSSPIITFPELHSDANSRKQSLATEERLSDGRSPNGKRMTAYLHVPSQRVLPPYLYEGSEEQDSSESSSVTSSESESERSFSPALLPVRWPIRQQQRRLPAHRTKFQQYPRQSSANVGVGWTVTVAGSNSQNQPDLEMRLSFPASARRPTNSQSDSGLGEDNGNNRGKEGENRSKKQNFLPPATPVQTTQRWTLTVKNGSERMQEVQKVEKNLFPSLPELSNSQGQIKNTKKANKVLKNISESKSPSHFDW